MPTVTLCGSMTHLDAMKKVATWLKDFGFDIIIPEGEKKAEGHREKIENDYIRKHYKHIKRSSAILVVNKPKREIDGYIGANTLMEMGFAYVLNKDIFLLHKPSSTNFGYEEILAMEPLILNGDLERITEYYGNLPIAFVASSNRLKIDAVDSAFRLMGVKTNVRGASVKSGISAQPLSLDETYEGARNRLANLEKAVADQTYEYLVSIESGNQEYKDRLYGLSVVMIKTRGNSQVKVGIVWDPAIPTEFLELVPSKYPDFGVLVQQEYGIKEKDPYLYLTNNQLSRFDFLVDAVIRALADRG